MIIVSEKPTDCNKCPYIKDCEVICQKDGEIVKNGSCPVISTRDWISKVKSGGIKRRTAIL